MVTFHACANSSNQKALKYTARATGAETEVSSSDNGFYTALVD